MKYFNDLTIEEMFEARDWWSSRSDDHRAWKNGVDQQKIIGEKIKELGGWNEEILTSHNKYAPKELKISEEEFNDYFLKK
jgi:hypothetical protein